MPHRTARAASLLAIVLGPLTACAASGSASAAGAPQSTRGPSYESPSYEAPGVTPTVALPPAHGVFDYQIGEPYPPAPNVQIVDRDRSKSPVPGRYNVCYLNALQTQPDEQGQSLTNPSYGTLQWWKKNHPELLVTKNGEVVVDPDWKEGVFDVSTEDKRVALLRIQKSWIDGCAAKGFDAIEPDNLDSYTRSKGAFDFGADEDYLAAFVPYAHSKGLAVAQKNTNTEFGASGKTEVGFDFAIAEECGAYFLDEAESLQECTDYTDVYGALVYEIEYTDNPRTAFTDSCAVRGDRISIILRDRDVVGAGDPAYHYELCP